MTRRRTILLGAALIFLFAVLYFAKNKLLSNGDAFKENPAAHFNQAKSGDSSEKNATTTSPQEIKDIRDRPFPMTGYGNDAGMETGDDGNVELINREPVQ